MHALAQTDLIEMTQFCQNWPNLCAHPTKHQLTNTQPKPIPTNACAYRFVNTWTQLKDKANFQPKLQSRWPIWTNCKVTIPAFNNSSHCTIISKRLTAWDTSKVPGPNDIPVVTLHTCAPKPSALLTKLF